ncbi:MAG TPA: site-2 protease family protein [Steroidobacteraceae bacterium]|jgi:Zn-dependent protease|nr:site-2 protease family protein [Steroidobacteraceae bacterium]
MVHARRLEELAASARAHEERGALAAAHDDWEAALELIPADSSQAAWVRAKRDELHQAVRRQAARESAPAWTRKLGPFAPIALLLLKGKALLSLLKLKFLLSFATFAALYWALYGFKFGIGFAVLILVHELGHFIEVRRRGLSAHLPMFIPGFGAYVRWTAAGATADTRALVSLAGPLAGAIGAALCALVWMQTQQRLWIALSSFSAFINLMNLIPLWTLDGGQAMAAINRAGRIGIAIAGILFAAYFSQPLLLLVVGGAVYRAFDKTLAPDMPPSYGVTAYFVTLLAVLGFLASLAPLGAPPR